MQPFQNFPCHEQLNLNFDKSASKPVVWQWNKLSPHTRKTILELAELQSHHNIIRRTRTLDEMHLKLGNGIG